MRIVVALGGNALLRRGEPMTARGPARQRADRAPGRWRRWPAAPAGGHRTATARRSACWPCRARPYKEVEAYPLDVLGAQTEGMIGYMIEQELGNLLPFEVPFATILTMVEVDPRRPGLPEPDQADRPGLHRGGGRAARRREGLDGGSRTGRWRRVVPSPLPTADLRDPAHQVAAREGHHRDLRRRRRHPHHVPPGRPHLEGVEAVIDKDRASAAARPRARGRPLRDGDRRRRRLSRLGDAGAAPAPPRLPRRARAATGFAAGSMGPKVEAACDFVGAHRRPRRDRRPGRHREDDCWRSRNADRAPAGRLSSGSGRAAAGARREGRQGLRLDRLARTSYCVGHGLGPQSRSPDPALSRL